MTWWDLTGYVDGIDELGSRRPAFGREILLKKRPGCSLKDKSKAMVIPRKGDDLDVRLVLKADAARYVLDDDRC